MANIFGIITLEAILFEFRLYIQIQQLDVRMDGQMYIYMHSHISELGSMQKTSTRQEHPPEIRSARFVQTKGPVPWIYQNLEMMTAAGSCAVMMFLD
ncbi:hypothetical protein DPMN_151549 [Dreissena polymorpha]|uniref:Uncharacterized protein n=1 Tax=Dreissena polymorpha TaxID=45954 RepID=A0A9D4J6L2_DREPO|nr:hypothetical protein DPMN_151549 [Dreissena polymorpha]